jgi:DNA polymerase-3 subunit epsilon
MFEAIKASPQDYRLSQRVPSISGKRLDTKSSRNPLEIVVLDLETTGLDPAVDRAIQVGLVPCRYCPERKGLLEVGTPYLAFEDPGFPLSDEITALTGITDADVRGQRFDDEAIASLLKAAPLVVAHNAWFDRPFWDRRFPHLSNLCWACSCREIDWRALGYEGAGLGPLVLQAGYFFEGHRAVDDCLAVAWLLHREPAAFENLLVSSETTTYKIEAFGSPIKTKEDMKARRYRWDATKGVWWKDDVVELEAELSFLDGLYAHARSRAGVTPKTARERFKKALPALAVARG